MMTQSEAWTQKILNIKTQTLLLGLMTLSALIIVPQIFFVGLGQDEMVTLYYTSPGLNPSLIWENTPPLYYWLLKIWFLIFPATPESARFFTFLIALPFPLLGYQIVNRFLGRSQAVLAVLLFTFCAIHIRYTLEVRAYVLLEMLALLNLKYLMEALEKKTLQTGYWLTAIALVFTHYLALALLFSHAVFFTFNSEKIRHRTWLNIGLIVVMVYAVSLFQPVSLLHLSWGHFYGLFTGENLKANFLNYLTALILVVIFFTFRSRKMKTIENVILLSGFFIFLSGLLIQRAPYVEKYYIFVVPYLLVWLSDVIMRQRRTVALCLIFLYFSLNVTRIVMHYNKAHSSWPEVFQALSAVQGPVKILTDEHQATAHYLSNEKVQIERLRVFHVEQYVPEEDFWIMAHDSTDFSVPGYDLLSFQQVGLQSYEPATLYHYKKVWK